MRLGHSRRRTPLATTERSQRQGGYVLVQFALLLVPLLLMAGFSVDVGYWYNRASNLQKAADAAALAGVVWLPDEQSAETYARTTAEKNGFKDGRNGITVDVEPVSGENRRLRVTITDPQVGSFFFASLGGDEIDISRRATAEYVLPVPLGSPENRFGTDTSLPVAQRANLWGNIHGPGTDNFKGDAYAPKCRGQDNCGPQTNPGYRSTGYLYTIDIPEGVTGMGVEVYDAGLYDRGRDESVETGDTYYRDSKNNLLPGTTTTNWTLYDRDDTELDLSDNPTAKSKGMCQWGTKGEWSLGQGEAPETYKNKWQLLCATAVSPGRYVLRVQTAGDGSSANRYALRVQTLGSSGTIGTQARLSAYGDMSMYNNVAAGNASFYLAEVDDIHRGKTLELKLYDPGEVSKVSGTTGDGTIQILDPSGNVTSTCKASATSGTIGSTLSPCQFKSASGGTAQFNGAWVTLQIPIPTNYTCQVGTIPGCWWKVKYIIDGQGNDTTTWTANIIGDPVHLIEEDEVS